MSEKEKIENRGSGFDHSDFNDRFKSKINHKKNRIDRKIGQKKSDVLIDRWSIFYWPISSDFMALRAP